MMVDRGGSRSLLIYDADDSDDADVPVQTILMEHDEADQIAEILHSRPLPDRLTAVERRLAELTGMAS
jgi:TrkA domain protein